MKISKRHLRRIIQEEKARLLESSKRARLRRIIREQADEAAGGAPNVNDVARKLSALGAEGALQWIGDLVSKLDVASAPAPEAAAPAPEPVMDEPLPEDLPK